MFVCSAFFIVVFVKNMMARRVTTEEVKYEERTYNLTTVSFDEVREQLGPVKADTTVVRTYTIVNTGEDSLHVLGVSPDCNCTGYQLSANAVAPGDSIQLTIEIDMRNKKHGRFMLSTVVALNTSQRLHHVSIEGQVTD